MLCILSIQFQLSRLIHFTLQTTVRFNWVQIENRFSAAVPSPCASSTAAAFIPCCRRNPSCCNVRTRTRTDARWHHRTGSTGGRWRRRRRRRKRPPIRPRCHRSPQAGCSGSTINVKVEERERKRERKRERERSDKLKVIHKSHPNRKMLYVLEMMM